MLCFDQSDIQYRRLRVDSIPTPDWNFTGNMKSVCVMDFIKLEMLSNMFLNSLMTFYKPCTNWDLSVKY